MRDKLKRAAPLLGVLILTGLLPSAAQSIPRVKPMTEEMRRKLLDANRQAPEPAPPPAPGEEVLVVPEDAQRTASGLAYKILEPGDGELPPGPNDTVTIHFVGWNARGAIFDTTTKGGRPRSFQVSRAAPGLAEGLRLMVEGGKWQLWIRQSLAAGQPEQLLQFDVELLSITRAPEPPPDLGATPPAATVAESGLAHRVLEPGKGAEHPQPGDLAAIHYTGWTQEGGLIGSSRMRSGPLSVTVGESVPAFDEALPQMVVGEQRRLWVPEGLGLDDERATGPTVFDLELVSLLVKPRTPPDVAQPAEDARRLESGLAYRLLQSGDGGPSPTPGSTVIVHYTVWNPAGELIDSSFEYGKPVGVKLDDTMPPGWNIALQQMTVGEKRRIWIPEELGFAQGQHSAAGAVVFDVELLAIEEDE